MSDVKLTDLAGLAKVLVRADPDSAVATAMGVPYGRAVSDASDTLVVGTAPDAWLVLSRADSASSVVQRIESLADGEFASVVDVTHGHSALRLTGSEAANVLATLCAVDLSDTAMPDGSTVRTLVAGITATAIRDDADGERSYLVLCDRSYGRYLIDVLTDAGQELATGCAVDGAERPGSY